VTGSASVRDGNHGMAPRHVFVTGGTGYLGRPLIAALLSRGHTVRALARASSRDRLPANCSVVLGDALDAATFSQSVAPADTLVHLVGTPHPSPRKAREFEMVDLASIRASVAAALASGVRHLVYVSVAQPAPVMQAYIAVRAAGEALVRESGIAATVLRPWYVLGPGHRWPYALIPLYWVAARLPASREGARRLGLVTRAHMVRALAAAVETPASGWRSVSVEDIRAARLGPATAS
jgi:uncharacterized protein YbjT (DUF2867 family)